MRSLGLMFLALLVAGCASSPTVSTADRDAVIEHALVYAREQLSGSRSAQVFGVGQTSDGVIFEIGYDIRWAGASPGSGFGFDDLERQMVARSREKGQPIVAMASVGYRKGASWTSTELAIFYEDVDGRANEIVVPYWYEDRELVFGDAWIGPSEPSLFVGDLARLRDR